MSHTPGPWTVGLYVAHESVFKETGLGNLYVATAASRDIPMEERQANARLIAAAPDLLELVNFVLACEGNDYAVNDQWVARAEATIAKVEGREP